MWFCFKNSLISILNKVGVNTNLLHHADTDRDRKVEGIREIKQMLIALRRDLNR
jgi:hypothetical protein